MNSPLTPLMDMPLSVRVWTMQNYSSFSLVTMKKPIYMMDNFTTGRFPPKWSRGGMDSDSGVYDYLCIVI